MTDTQGIFRDKKEDGVQQFFDRVTEIKMPCKELNWQLCSIRMIKFFYDQEGEGKVIYIKTPSKL